MKKIFIALLACLLPISACAWVFLTDAENKDAGLLLPKIISQKGQNVRVCMDVMPDLDPALYAPSKELSVYLYKTYAPYLVKGYQTWFDALRSGIIQSGRQDEFADILALLPPKKISFSFTNPDASPCTGDNNQDLYVRLVSNPSASAGKSAGAYMRQHSRFAALTLNSAGYKIPEQLSDILLHEIGHTLGLGDMYREEKNSAHNSHIYTMAQTQELDSIDSCMNNTCRGKVVKNINFTTYYPFSQQKLTCDDLDGLVNLLDYYFPDQMSVRRTQGWMSLCPQRNVMYVASLPVPVSAEEKASFDSFAASGRQGISPLADKAANALAQTARLETARKERARQESLAAQEKEKQAAQEALQTALAAEKKQQQYNALLQSTPQVPNECPICRKPLRNGTKIGIVCDRAEDGSIRGCIAKHSACGAGWTKSQLREFLKNTDPKFVKSTNRIQIADTSLPSWASE